MLSETCIFSLALQPQTFCYSLFICSIIFYNLVFSLENSSLFPLAIQLFRSKFTWFLCPKYKFSGERIVLAWLRYPFRYVIREDDDSGGGLESHEVYECDRDGESFRHLAFPSYLVIWTPIFYWKHDCLAKRHSPVSFVASMALWPNSG